MEIAAVLALGKPLVFACGKVETEGRVAPFRRWGAARVKVVRGLGAIAMLKNCSDMVDVETAQAAVEADKVRELAAIGPENFKRINQAVAAALDTGHSALINQVFEVDAFNVGEPKPLQALPSLRVPDAFASACAAGQLEVIVELWRTHTEAMAAYLAGEGRVGGTPEKTGRWYPVWLASLNGRHAVVKWLLEEVGAAADGNPERGGTALSAAAQRGHLEVVRMLVAAGVDVNQIGKISTAAESGTGSRVVDADALSFAVQRAHAEVVEVLLKAGANVNPVATRSHPLVGYPMTLLGTAISTLYVCVNGEDPFTQTPAVRMKIMKLLVAAGANVDDDPLVLALMMVMYQQGGGDVPKGDANMKSLVMMERHLGTGQIMSMISEPLQRGAMEALIGKCALSPYTPSTNSVSCDGCSKPVAMGDSAFSCRKCNFDLCQECMGGANSLPMVEKDVAAAAAANAANASSTPPGGRNTGRKQASHEADEGRAGYERGPGDAAEGGGGAEGEGGSTVTAQTGDSSNAGADAERTLNNNIETGVNAERTVVVETRAEAADAERALDIETRAEAAWVAAQQALAEKGGDLGAAVEWLRMQPPDSPLFGDGYSAPATATTPAQAPTPTATAVGSQVSATTSAQASTATSGQDAISTNGDEREANDLKNATKARQAREDQRRKEEEDRTREEERVAAAANVLDMGVNGAFDMDSPPATAPVLQSQLSTGMQETFEIYQALNTPDSQVRLTTFREHPA